MEDMKRRFKAALPHGSILDLMAGIVLVVVLILAFTQSGTDQATTGLLVVFLAYLLFMRQGRLATVKFNKEGFEATMAQAREATQEAKETTREVKEFMKSTSIAVLGLVKGTGRTGVYGYEDKEQIRRDILSRLAELGIPPQEVEEVEKKSNWHEYVALDYVCFILGGRYDVWGSIPGASQEAERLRWRTLANLATPDELEALFKQYKMLTPEVAGLIEDYRYYLKHHKQRRPEMWAKRDQWYQYLKPRDGTGMHPPKERSDWEYSSAGGE